MSDIFSGEQNLVKKQKHNYELRKQQLNSYNESEFSKCKDNVDGKKWKIVFTHETLFLAACAASDIDEATRLLELNPDIIDTCNVDGLRALHQAVLNDDIDFVEFLISNGADIDVGDNEGWTPLHAAASCGLLSHVKYLVDAGANVISVNSDGDTPIDIAEDDKVIQFLSEAIEAQNLDIESARKAEEKLMLEHAITWLESGRIIEDVHPRSGATALHVAAAKNYLEVMSTLLKAGADVDAKDKDSWTPLHAASHWNLPDAAKILVEYSANMNLRNSNGHTCFDIAEEDMCSVLKDLQQKQDMLVSQRKNRISDEPQKPKPAVVQRRRSSVSRISAMERITTVKSDMENERDRILGLDRHPSLISSPSNHLSNESSESIEDNSLHNASISSLDPFETTNVSNPEFENAAFSSLPRPSLTSVISESPPKEPSVLELPNSQEESKITRTPSWRVKKSTPNQKGDNDSVITSTPETPQESSLDSENITPNVIMIPSRDGESETERKNKARFERRTRQSTQGVSADDVLAAMALKEKSGESVTLPIDPHKHAIREDKKEEYNRLIKRKQQQSHDNSASATCKSELPNGRRFINMAETGCLPEIQFEQLQSLNVLSVPSTRCMINQSVRPSAHAIVTPNATTWSYVLPLENTRDERQKRESKMARESLVGSSQFSEVGALRLPRHSRNSIQRQVIEPCPQPNLKHLETKIVHPTKPPTDHLTDSKHESSCISTIEIPNKSSTDISQFNRSPKFITPSKPIENIKPRSSDIKSYPESKKNSPRLLDKKPESKPDVRYNLSRSPSAEYNYCFKSNYNDPIFNFESKYNHRPPNKQYIAGNFEVSTHTSSEKSPKYHRASTESFVSSFERPTNGPYKSPNNLYTPVQFSDKPKYTPVYSDKYIVGSRSYEPYKSTNVDMYTNKYSDQRKYGESSYIKSQSDKSLDKYMSLKSQVLGDRSRTGSNKAYKNYNSGSPNKEYTFQRGGSLREPRYR